MKDKNIVSISPVFVSTARNDGTTLANLRKTGVLTGYYHEQNNLVPLVKWKDKTEPGPVFESIYVLNSEFKLLPKQKDQLYMCIKKDHINFWLDTVLYNGEIGTIRKIENNSNTIIFYQNRDFYSFEFVFYTDKEYPEELVPVIPVETYILNLEEKQKQNIANETVKLNKDNLYVVQTND